MVWNQKMLQMIFGQNTKPNGWKDRIHEPKFEKATDVEYTQGDASFANEIHDEKAVKKELDMMKETFKYERERQSGGSSKLRIEVNDFVAFKCFDSIEDARKENYNNMVTWGIRKVVKVGEKDVKIHRYGVRKAGSNQYFQNRVGRVRALLLRGKGRNAFYQTIERESIFMAEDIEFTNQHKLTNRTLKIIDKHPSSK